MTLRLYTDENVHARIIRGLRERGIDVLTASEDGHRQTADPIILRRATELGRAVFTHDQDHLSIGADFQRSQQVFMGIIYAHPDALSIAEFVEQLELAAHYEPDEVCNQIVFLPLR